MESPDHIQFELEPAGGPFHDPALLVTPQNSRQSVLFDCGTLHNLKTKHLLRTQWLFLTHLHIDHLIGFDHLLRVRLFSPLPLHVFGPPGTTETIAHRLLGYTWNLTSGSPFEVTATDLSPGARSVRFRCHDRFEAEELETGFERPVSLGQRVSVDWAEVKHGVPCLCYRLDRTLPPKFSLETCHRLGLTPGPWVRELTEGGAVELEVEGIRRGRDWLASRLLIQQPEQRLGYLTDTLLDAQLLDKLKDFYRRVDILISESAYLEAEEETATRNLHMTTSQVARLARGCEARRLLIFHLSRRHAEEGWEGYLREVRAIFPRADLLSRCSSGTLS